MRRKKNRKITKISKEIAQNNDRAILRKVGLK